MTTIPDSFSSLSKELITSDVDIKVSRCLEVRRIQKQIESLVQHILDKVHEEDWRFKSKLLKVGSFYDKLKIGLPDEFDFLIELQNFVEHENFEVRPSGFKGTRNLWRTPPGHPALKKIQVLDENFKSINTDQENDNWFCRVGTKSYEEYILDGVKVKNIFYYLVVQTVKNLNEGRWSRFLAVEDEPTFVFGPAVTLQLLWNGRKFKNLKISVDLTVCITAKSLLADFDIFERINPESHITRYLYKIISKNGYHLTPHISDYGHIQWRVSTSYIESRLLQIFPQDSKLKTVIRNIKHTRDLHLKRLPPMDEMSDPAMRSIVQFIGFYEGKDVYEQKDLVPSYIIKTAALHAIGHVSQKEWNTASLASLYAYTFCHIYLMIREKCARNFFIWKHKINVPDFGDVLPGFLNVFKLVKIDDKPAECEEDKTVFKELTDAEVRKLFVLVKDDVNLHYNVLWKS